MAEVPTHAEVRLDEQGSVVVPASLRRLLGFEPGDKLVAHIEQGRLIFEKQETVKQRLKARFARVTTGKSLADELVAERRAEARREIDT